jgi:hypothetical protein
MTNNTSSLRFAASGTPAPSLAVSFPPQERIRTAKKSVQIALLSHQRTYRPAEHESSSKSYTKADYRRFSDLRNHDIVKYSHLVADKVRSGERLTKTDLCLCTGLEAFLSPDVPKRIKKINKAREAHVKLILLAQEQGCGINIISQVSRKSSRSAMARAQNAAMACYSASD